jgi:hypothetical protein
LLTTIFIEYVEEATWLSPIVITPKKNGKLRICIDFKKLNVATKKDPYPLPFRNEVMNTITGYEASNIYRSKGQIQDYICYKLGGFYMEGDDVWSLKWTSNILESHD